MYEYYKQARYMSWDILIKCNIKSLPVNLVEIAKYYDIEIVRYSQTNLIQLFNQDALSGDGFIALVKNKKVIYINDKIKTRGRRRFTFAHELGHAILDHPLTNMRTRNSEIDSKTDPYELQANVVARNILAPACVLNDLGVSTAEEIMQICDISKQSAEIRLERLNELRKRGRFFTSPLEAQVYEQFKPFIEDFKKSP